MLVCGQNIEIVCRKWTVKHKDRLLNSFSGLLDAKQYYRTVVTGINWIFNQMQHKVNECILVESINPALLSERLGHQSFPCCFEDPSAFGRNLIYSQSQTNSVLITQRVCWRIQTFVSLVNLFLSSMMFVKMILHWNSPGSECGAALSFVQQGWVNILGLLEMYPTPICSSSALL